MSDVLRSRTGHILSLQVTDGEEIDLTSTDYERTGDIPVDQKGFYVYVGSTGNIKVDTIDGATLTYNNIEVGFIPVLCVKVYQTGTTATDLIANW